ncbi:MAG: dTDP-glucose 4,6-dehydratase [Patescibacteria group bacterium]
MKILVTGGAGFMGSHFIKYILKNYLDYEIINLDKLTYAGNLENLTEIEKNSRYKFIQGDISNAEDVKKALGDGVDLIVNYAAETHVDRSILNPDSFLKTDIFGTFVLLEATRNGLAKKMIQISTDEVFGMVQDESQEFSEETKFDPSSPYSASKAGADMMCAAYYHTYKTPVIMTHSCNFYGTHQYPEKIIPLFITNLLEDKKVPLYGEGMQFREWIHTSDHCRAIDLICHYGKLGEVYNIGTRFRISNKELTNMLLKLTSKDMGYIEKVTDRPGHDFGYAVNPDKLMSLGWKPEKDFEEGLKETVDWYSNNYSWWQKIKSGEYLDYYQQQYKK